MADKKQVFRLTIHGYERPSEEWLKTDIEYQTANNLDRRCHWEFDTVSLARSEKLLRKRKSRQGIYLNEKFDNFKFSFRVNKTGLYQFEKAIIRAAGAFPAATEN